MIIVWYKGRKLWFVANLNIQWSCMPTGVRKRRHNCRADRCASPTPSGRCTSIGARTICAALSTPSTTSVSPWRCTRCTSRPSTAQRVTPSDTQTDSPSFLSSIRFATYLYLHNLYFLLLLKNLRGFALVTKTFIILLSQRLTISLSILLVTNRQTF